MLSKYLDYTKTYNSLLILISLLLPFTEYFSTQFTSIAIILLLVSWLLLNDFSILIDRLKAEKIIFLFLIFYLINIQGLFREANNVYTEKVLIKKLSLFILPLIIGTSPSLKYSFVLKVMAAFIISLFLSSLFTYINGIDKFVTTPEGLNNLSGKIIIHRPYFGFFCAFSIISLIVIYLKKYNNLLHIGIIVLIIYYLFFIALVQAKMSFIALVLCAITLFYIWLLLKRRYLVIILSFILILAGLGRIYQSSSTVKTYVNNIINRKGFSYTDYNILVVGSINVRYVNWGCAFSILNEKRNWLYGVGAGNAQPKLQECYNRTNSWVYSLKMNSHNQIIEETLYNGIIGLALFMGIIFLPGFVSYKRKNFFHLAFLTLFFFCCITESILSRQIGIVFFAFFNSILYFNYNNITKKIQFYEQKDCLS